MALSTDDVAGIARYARIALTPQELDDMTAYLNDAIALLEPLRAADLSDVEPTFHPLGGRVNVTRPDVPAPGLSQAEALANAASKRDGSVRVPAILPSGGAS